MKTIDKELARTAAEFHNAVDDLSDNTAWARVARPRRRFQLAAVATLLIAVVAVPLILSRTGSPDRTPTASAATPTSTIDTATTTSTSIATGPQTRPQGPVFDPSGRNDWDWTWPDQVAAINAGEATWAAPGGVRHVLTDIASAVPAIGNAHLLAIRTTEWFEDAFYLLADGSDTMVYIGWNELRSTDAISIEAWQQFEATGDDPIKIVLPTIDDLMQQGLQDDILVLSWYTDTVIDFVADTAPIVVTVRFFQLADTYGSEPLAISSDNATRLFNDILTSLNLPKNDPGELAPPPDISKPRVDVLKLVAAMTDGTQVPDVVVCSPDHPPVGDDNPVSPVADQPVQALADFLDAHRQGADYLPLPRSGYIENRMPDGSIIYVHPFEADPATAVGWVTVSESSSGWRVTAWKAAGC